MTTKQLNGYRVEFYSEEEWNNYKVCGTNERNRLPIGIPINCCSKELLNCEYVGLVTEIPEELAEKIVSSWQDYESLSLDVSYNGYRDYKSSSTYEYAKYPFKNAKDSFKTLSDLPYCIITKNE